MYNERNDFMENLMDYVKRKHKGKTDWFLEEIVTVSNMQNVRNVKDNRQYLDGFHDILDNQNYVYNGEVVQSRKIVIQSALTLLQFQVEYLLRYEPKISGNEQVADTLNLINKMGNFNHINKEILSNILRYGSAGEYVYIDKKGKIRSKVLAPDQFVAIRDRHNEVLGVVEFYKYDGVDSYVVYSEDTVQEYDNISGKMVLRSQYANLSGLPVIYGDGRPVLDDWKGILDQIEQLFSKVDATYKHISGIPVVTGQQLTGQLPINIVGGGLQLDDGSTFGFASNPTDIESFNSIYDALSKELLNVSMTPAISMNSASLTNISTESIRIMFSLADVRGSLNQSQMEIGMLERYEKIRTLLEFRGVSFTDADYYTMSIVFTFNQPSNETEVVNNLVNLRNAQLISLETSLERSPYTTDANQEIDRLSVEGTDSKIEDNTLV